MKDDHSGPRLDVSALTDLSRTQPAKVVEFVSSLKAINSRHGLEFCIAFGEAMARLQAVLGDQMPAFAVIVSLFEGSPSGSTLKRANDIYHQMQIVPSDIEERMSYDHHRSLLGVRNDKLKRQVVRSEFRDDRTPTDTEFRLAVEQFKKDNPEPATKGGRPRLPDSLKAARKLARAVKKHASLAGEVDGNATNAHNAEERALLESVKSWIDQRIEALAKAEARDAKKIKTPKKARSTSSKRTRDEPNSAAGVA